MSDHDASYYLPEDLENFGAISEEAPELAAQFFRWYASATGEGALTSREKALIALAVAHTVQCPYCIDAYSTGALKHGADAEQMMEAVHVAAAIQAGSSLVHGVQMKKHIQDVDM